MIKPVGTTLNKRTIVRANPNERSLLLRHNARVGCLLARYPSSRRDRLRAASADLASAGLARPGSIKDRLVIGILTLIAVGYGVAVLLRIVAQYGY